MGALSKHPSCLLRGQGLPAIKGMEQKIKVVIHFHQLHTRSVLMCLKEMP